MTPPKERREVGERRAQRLLNLLVNFASLKGTSQSNAMLIAQHHATFFSFVVSFFLFLVLFFRGPQWQAGQDKSLEKALPVALCALQMVVAVDAFLTYSLSLAPITQQAENTSRIPAAGHLKHSTIPPFHPETPPPPPSLPPTYTSHESLLTRPSPRPSQPSLDGCPRAWPRSRPPASG